MKSKIVIINYGLGNIHSISKALEAVGLNSFVSRNPGEIMNSDALILPGVGAFGNAMENLSELKLVNTIKDFARTGKMIVGICLGMQLLMSNSSEFGSHTGLNLIKGNVRKFRPSGKLKVPYIGWQSVDFVNSHKEYNGDVVRKIYPRHTSGQKMYFVHSYYVIPDDDTQILTTTNYGDFSYCSSINYNNIYGFQFHPEKSGPAGLDLYRNLFRF